jgi:hypothetical protein
MASSREVAWFFLFLITESLKIFDCFISINYELMSKHGVLENSLNGFVVES